MRHREDTLSYKSAAQRVEIYVLRVLGDVNYHSIARPPKIPHYLGIETGTAVGAINVLDLARLPAQAPSTLRGKNLRPAIVQ